MTDNTLIALYGRLMDSLEAELKSHDHLLNVIIEETQALRGGLLPDIHAVGVRKAEAFRKSEQAASRRAEDVGCIVAHLGLEEPVSFARMAGYADEVTRQRLTAHREKFSGTLYRIEQANESNRQIIALSLAHVSNNLNFIHNISSSIPNYDQHGQIKARNLQGRLISQAG